MNKFQYFDVETSVNDKRTIKGFELSNKIKVILISDPNIFTSSCSVGVGAGYFNDDFPGTAHFLEHLLFMGSEKYPEQNEYHSYIQINGGYDNAYTGDKITCYYLSLETSFLKKGIEILSWFFRAPLLGLTHIKSEMEIIDSEHNKNILSDHWIMDDIFKNFIQDNSKYKKFGTGNMESLNNITKKDIVDFYDKYYTTDNIFVCIIDSKDIETMINEYLGYFEDIPEKKCNIKNKFEKIPLKLIQNDLIIYNSISDYKFFNCYVIIDGIESNQIDYQLVSFIEFIIGEEYPNSLSYYLKENDIVKNIYINTEYFYDYSINMKMEFILVNHQNKQKIFEQICYIYHLIIKLFNKLKTIDWNEFSKLYKNFSKIKILELLYNNHSDSASESNRIVENMIRSKPSESIIREYKVPKLTKNIYEKFINMISTICIKITTNSDFISFIDLIEPNDYTKSLWYSSSYIICKKNYFKTKLSKKISKILVDKFNINLLNSIGINNFTIKTINTISNPHDKTRPELVYSNNKINRDIYFLDINKYSSPISNFTIIRRNCCLKNDINIIILNIYFDICDKILNYYYAQIGHYKMKYISSIDDDCYVQSFYGLDYLLNNFITHIMSQIHPDTIFLNLKTKKYFELIKRNIIELFENMKYDSPHIICSRYKNSIISNKLGINETIKLIMSLEYDDFEEICRNCLKYSYEYYLLIGINKNGNEISNSLESKYIFLNDKYISGLLEQVSLNPKKYLDINLSIKSKTNFKKLSNKYIIKYEDFNSQEINNCVIRFWNINNISIELDNINKIKFKTIENKIKNCMICDFVSEMMNEPLFDKIRTIDKLGYIVKSGNNCINITNKFSTYIYYIIQSSHPVNRIIDSINDFSKYIKNDIKNNYGEYLEKFRLKKEYFLLEYEKNYSNIYDESYAYILSIVMKLYDFNINLLYKKICKNLDFDKDIYPIIVKITQNNTEFHDIILDKDNIKKID